MKKHKPADSIQDIQYFGEYGGVNPSIADSSTFTYLAGKTMEMVFGGEREGCYLYSRHTNPSTAYLAEAIAKIENTEAAHVSASGMGAISAAILQICSSGSHIHKQSNHLWRNLRFYEKFSSSIQYCYFICGYNRCKCY